MSINRKKITVEIEKFRENVGALMVFCIQNWSDLLWKKIVLQNYKFSIIKIEKYRENAGA